VTFAGRDHDARGDPDEPLACATASSSSARLIVDRPGTSSALAIA
jgi:hypothetical protein